MESQENGETFRHATVSHEFKTALQQDWQRDQRVLGPSWEATNQVGRSLKHEGQDWSSLAYSAAFEEETHSSWSSKIFLDVHHRTQGFQKHRCRSVPDRQARLAKKMTQASLATAINEKAHWDSGVGIGRSYLHKSKSWNKEEREVETSRESVCIEKEKGRRCHKWMLDKFRSTARYSGKKTHVISQSIFMIIIYSEIKIKQFSSSCKLTNLLLLPVECDQRIWERQGEPGQRFQGFFRAATYTRKSRACREYMILLAHDWKMFLVCSLHHDNALPCGSSRVVEYCRGIKGSCQAIPNGAIINKLTLGRSTSKKYSALLLCTSFDWYLWKVWND